MGSLALIWGIFLNQLGPSELQADFLPTILFLSICKKKNDIVTTMFFTTLLTIAKGVSLVALSVKKLPAMQDTWVGSLSQEDPLGREMATHFCILA